MIKGAFSDSFTIKKYDFAFSALEKITNDLFVKELWPLVYIIYCNQLKQLYVGETANGLSRIASHLVNDKKQKLDSILLITSDKFNKSATLDIESSLIKYLSSDEQFDLLNGNAGLMNHSYYLRNEYTILFGELWEELKNRKIAVNDLKKIDNSNIFKYSPYKALNSDQINAVGRILKLLSDKGSRRILVEGGAGTGKTVLATFLAKLLRTNEADLTDIEEGFENEKFIKLIKALKLKWPDPKIALVVPMTSLRKTLKRVFRATSGLTSDMVIGPSEVAKNKYDILIVDEAHRLKRRVNITNYRDFDLNNKRLGLTQEGNELDWILMQSKYTILFYDEKQSIKPSDVRKEVFNKLKAATYTTPLILKSQMRVRGGLDYISYVESLLDNRLNGTTSKFSHKDYELILFENITDFIKAIQIKEEDHGLSRMIAGFAWQWKSKTGHKFDIKIENTKLVWNRTNEDWINSKTSINEVGCIHTTQGYDLNYAGIIFGNEISFDPAINEIVIREDQYFDQKGKINVRNSKELSNYILNIYKTLMCRAIRGTYIYVCDENLRKYFSKHIHKFK